jgi:tRNA G18 (ribose-2'-O)-methylase SpoU
MPTLHILAHDIRSAQNVGSLLRTCDSLGVAKLWLTGYTPLPDHPRVAKTALGAEKSVAWEKGEIIQTISRLKAQGFRIIGLELDERARELAKYEPPEKAALLLGNEVEGLAPSLREVCDDLICMTQHGSKESMNVSVAAGIAAYWLLNA